MADQALMLVLALLAVLAIAGLVHKFGLGSDVRLRDTTEAQALVQAAICDFEPTTITIDRAGIAALLADADGRIILLRRHGAHFVARLLTTHRGVRLDRNFLEIATGDPHFGRVTLDLRDQAQHWAAALRRLGA